MEPDSEGHRASAIWAKRKTGRYPVLAPGDHHPDYGELWSWILDGTPENARLHLAARVLSVARPREINSYLRGDGSFKMAAASLLGRHPTGPTGARRSRPLDQGLLVKTVHAPLSVEWLDAEFDIEVLVVLRHPGSVLASWLALDFIDQHVAFEESGRAPAGLPLGRPLARLRPTGEDHLAHRIAHHRPRTGADRPSIVGDPNPRAAVPRSGHRVPEPLQRPGPELEPKG